MHALTSGFNELATLPAKYDYDVYVWVCVCVLQVAEWLHCGLVSSSACGDV